MSDKYTKQYDRLARWMTEHCDERLEMAQKEYAVRIAELRDALHRARALNDELDTEIGRRDARIKELEAEILYAKEHP